MSSNKRKVFEDEFSEEDFDKPRRSSLQVNLSYTSNVTDSGRGSFRRTDETITEPPNRNILSLRGKRIRNNLPSKESEPPPKRERKLPKIISIQSNIKNQEQVLYESCSQLRDAILRKTREIFDQGNELAIKTSQVLQEGSRMIKSAEEEFSRSLILDKDSRSVVLEKDSRSVILEQDQLSRSAIPEKKSTRPLVPKESGPPTKSLKSMILEMSTNTRSTLLEKMKESKLIPQTSQGPRSTAENSQTLVENNQDCRSPSVRVALREDQQIIMSGKNKNANPVRINVMNSPSSKQSELDVGTPKKPRVSDSLSERQGFPKKRLFSDENNPQNNFPERKDPLQKIFLEPSKPWGRFASPILSASSRKRSRLSLRRTQKENENSQKNKDLTLLKESVTKGDGIITPGFPLTCSSFIDNRNQNENPDAGHFSGRGTNNSSCMEITAIPNVLPISVRDLSCDKENSRKKAEESFKGSQDKRVLSMELTEVKGNILSASPLRRGNSGMEKAPGDVLENEEIEDVSVRTTGTSLNVNTSEEVFLQRKKNAGTVYSFNSSGSKRTKQSQVNTGTIRSSLQVNTSLDYVPKTRRKKLTLNEIPTESNSKAIVSVNIPIEMIASEGNLISRDSDPVETNTDRVKSNPIRNQSTKVPVKSNSMNQENSGSLERNKTVQLIDESNSVLVTSSLLEKSLSESLENVSLMERLKFFFLKPASARITRNSRSSRSKNSTNGIGEMSRVEGTPLPISRSFLWKSQIKQNTFASNWNYNSSEKSNETVDNVQTSQGHLRKSKGIERLPALTNSESEAAHPSSESPEKISTKSNNSSKPEDSSLDNSRKRRKRKLYPLQGRSELLSLSPVQSATPSPKQVVFPKRKKNRKWLKLQKAKQAENSLRTQKTQRTQDVRNNLDVSRSSADSAEYEPVKVPTQQSTRRKKPRKVLRKKIVLKKMANSSVATKMKKDKLRFTEQENSEGGRSSLNDFEPKKKDNKSKKIAKRIIVTTGFSNEDKSLVKSVVKKLGKAEMEINVTRKTTHIVSTGVRTINLLKGIIRGCWLVSLDWVLNSLEHGDWLSPEPYEMVHFSAAVQENRRDRQLFGNVFVPDLFSTCGTIYIQNGTNPASSSLKELVKAAGGQITEDSAVAKIVVGSEGLKEIWILDSITTGVLQPLEQYRRN